MSAGIKIGLEWKFKDKDYSCGWCDFTGANLPLLPIGSRILAHNEFEDEEDNWTEFLLEVKDVQCYYNVGKTASINMICTVIDNVG